jgi:peptide/nickel transport system ATP-binding protein
VMITHDLGVVAEVTDDIGVMYAGRIVEYADKEAIFAAPEHPYTWGLLKSIPRLDSPRGEELVPIPGRPPSLILKPAGCAFHPRCPYVRDAHMRIDPQLAPAAEVGNGGGHKHEVACLLPGQTRRALWTALQAGEVPQVAMEHVHVPEAAVDREAVGEVLAPAGTEVAEGVVAPPGSEAPPVAPAPLDPADAEEGPR